jgi:hypothetical protein
MPSNDYLMVRSAQRARLEARTASLQFFFRCVNQLPDSLGSGAAGQRQDPNWAKSGRDAGEPRGFGFALPRSSPRRA